MYFLGCDGGSTKTEFILSDENGAILSHRVYAGCNYSHLGREGFERHMTSCIGEVLADARITKDDVTYAALGLPTYGEVEETEETIPDIIAKLLPFERVRLANDAVMGWAGSLGAQPGINVVAGTGAIAYGMDYKGSEKRVGGWNLFFSDEGSCSWVGIRAMAAFFKQSDGRLPRTALYDVFKEHFSLTKKDIYFVGNIVEFMTKQPSQFAKMQLLAEKAYRMGDETMKKLYEDAVWELTEMVRAVKEGLAFAPGEAVRVSYSGGLFRAGEVVLAPLRARLSSLGMELVSPKYPPYIGSLALAAAKHLPAGALEALCARAYDETQGQ